jgi:integrase
MGVAYPLTPRAMRRTFNDVARWVGINDIVTRSITGHQSAAMQAHYSTAADSEQASALSKVHAVVEGGRS